MTVMIPNVSWKKKTRGGKNKLPKQVLKAVCDSQVPLDPGYICFDTDL